LNVTAMPLVAASALLSALAATAIQQ